jgi:NADH dehydrogenase
MNLIVGATGTLGGEICRLLASRGHAVRALVRSTSNPERIAALRKLGVELVQGDLKDPASLRDACRGVSAVISTASSTISRQDGDSIDAVDRQGQLKLVAAAESADVGHFIYISFPPIDIDFPLQDAKREVEARLRQSRIAHTILQPTCFMEVWLSPVVGFDPANAKAQICGTGRNRMSWISFLDVARFAVAALEEPRARGATLELGGPEALSALEVVRLAEQLTGQTVVLQHVPEEALSAQLDAATDTLQKTFAGLMLYCARGDVIDMAGTRRVLPVENLRTVRDHLTALTAVSSAARSMAAT